MATNQQREVKWDKKVVEEFSKRFVATMTWAEEAGVPMPVMEGAVRDWLAGLEALRQARMLAMQFEALGAPGFVRPVKH